MHIHFIWSKPAQQIKEHILHYFIFANKLKLWPHGQNFSSKELKQYSANPLIAPS